MGKHSLPTLAMNNLRSCDLSLYFGFLVHTDTEGQFKTILVDVPKMFITIKVIDLLPSITKKDK